MATSRAREIAKDAGIRIRKVWRSGSDKDAICAEVCEESLQQFAREMAEKIRAKQRNPANRDDHFLNGGLREAAQIILDAAGITEGRDDTHAG